MELTINTQDALKKMWFHQEFISGEDENYEYSLSSTAGCGSDVLIFRVKNKKTGVSVREYASVSEMFEKWIEEKIKLISTTKQA